MLYIFRGDDIAFAEYDRRICIRLDTFKDLTGWSAKFKLVDNEKVFTDISSRLISFGYTAEETSEFPLGKTYGKLTIYDSKGQIRQMVQVDVEILNKVPEAGIGGTIAVSVDNVIADYNNIGNKPSINGVTIEGDHDSAYYKLAGASACAANAEMIAIHASQIEGLKQTVQTTNATVADQGVAIAQNNQNIQVLKISVNKACDDVEVLKKKVKDVADEASRQVLREESARKEEDASLSARIDNEVNERSSADRSIRADLESEKNTRGTETAQLAQKITSETTSRQADTQNLTNSIEAEAQQRKSGDKLNADKLEAATDQLQNKIDIVASNLADARGDFDTDLTREADARRKADEILDAKIAENKETAATALAAEAATRKEVDDLDRQKMNAGFAELSGKLAAEVRARQFTDDALTSEGVKRERKDNALEASITTEATTRASEDTRVLDEAKAYADQIGEHALHYCGQVDKVSDLQAISNPKVGDMYNVKETGANYAWNGTEWDKLSETIDLTPFLKKEEFQTYLTQLQAADAANEAAIEAEATARETAVETEKTARVAADKTLQENITAEANSRSAADVSLGQRIDAEQTNRETEDANIRSTIDSKVTELKAADSGLSTKIDGVKSDLATERDARIAADETEKRAREEAMSTEVTARNSAIEIESTAREAADTSEASIRSEADTNLGNRITAETKDRSAAITKEIEDRGTADNLIYEKVELERQQSVARDNTLTENLTNEVTNRTSEDVRVLDEAKAYADSVGAKAMHFKGTVANRSELEAITDMQQGDMYNVEEYKFDDETVVKGANFAWTGTRWDKLSENIDLTPYAKTADMVAADAALSERIDTNAANITAARSVADTAKTTADTANAKATANEKAIADEVSRAKAAENINAQAVADEALRAKGIEGGLRTDLTTVQSGLTVERDTRATEDVRILQEAKDYCDEKESGIEERVNTLSATVASQAETIAFWSEKIDANEKNIAAEIERAKAKEAELLEAINKEISDREKAVSDEATARTNADTTLQTNIDNEAAARGSADDTLQDNIDAEETNRANADTALGTRIDGVVSDLGTEKKNREDADTALGTRIGTEETNRANADTALGTRIGNEETARTTAITNLTSGKTLISQLLFSSTDDATHNYQLKVVLVPDGEGGVEPSLQLVEVVK